MRRFAFIAAACATLCAAGPALARAPRHHRPLVDCAVTICITHFKVQVSGSQYTSWVVPSQQNGGGDCYQVPYVKGSGEQNVMFRGSAAVVEAMRIGSGPPSFETLVPGQARPEGGIGEGGASITREGTLIQWVEPGKCGANNRPTTNAYSGCGKAYEDWMFDLLPDSADRVSLTGGSVAPSLTDPYIDCPLLWTGSESISGNDTGLYSGFTVPLPASELFSPAHNKIIVHGRYSVADAPPANMQYTGVTGETLVNWTVTLTRIAHAQFPVAQ